jgi:hypothetical protein
MSEPTSRSDPVDQADAWSRHRRDLEEIVDGVEPLREDESFEVPDLTDDEWQQFVQAIQE